MMQFKKLMMEMDWTTILRPISSTEFGVSADAVNKQCSCGPTNSSSSISLGVYSLSVNPTLKSVADEKLNLLTNQPRIASVLALNSADLLADILALVQEDRVEHKENALTLLKALARILEHPATDESVLNLIPALILLGLDSNGSGAQKTL